MDDTVVSVTDLAFSYGPKPVLEGISLGVRRGTIFSLLGPNGAGKTTTVELMEGYLRPDSGSVRILGEDPRRSRAVRSKIGVMLQKPGIYPAIKAKEAIQLFGSYHPDPMRVEAVLSLTGLTELADSKVRTLSGGEMQRLSLGLALVGKPKVLFLDEPTSGMDPIARASTWDHLQSLSDTGTSIFMTTHALQEAEYLSDRVAIIDGGRIVIEGTPQALTSRAAGFEFRTQPPIESATLASEIASQVVELSPGWYRVEQPATPDLMARLTRWTSQQGSMLSELKTRSTLEDVYLKALESEKATK